MRTRFFRIAATAGATALLVGFGALGAAGSASAATAPTATTAVAAHHLGNEQCPPSATCINLDDLLGLHLGIVISPVLIGL